MSFLPTFATLLLFVAILRGNAAIEPLPHRRAECTSYSVKCLIAHGERPGLEELALRMHSCESCTDVCGQQASETGDVGNRQSLESIAGNCAHLAIMERVSYIRRLGCSCRPPALNRDVFLQSPDLFEKIQRCVHCTKRAKSQQESVVRHLPTLYYDVAEAVNRCQYRWYTMCSIVGSRSDSKYETIYNQLCKELNQAQPKS